MAEGFFTRMRMRLLPASSRSFHSRTDEVMEHLRGLEGRLDETSSRLEALSQQIAIHDAHSKLRLEALYRIQGESPEQSKRRFFASIPPAEGDMRLFQLANARLMKDLDEFCSRYELDYWFLFGTLVAAVSRQGFIPWDDDIDICMMRSDVEKLRSLLDDNDDYQLTLVYDRTVLCKQYRFSSKKYRIPCFIDVCVWDWARTSSEAQSERMRELRLTLMRELEDRMGSFPYWHERLCLFADGGFVVQGVDVDRESQDDERACKEIAEIESVFSRYLAKAKEEGIVLDTPSGKQMPEGVAYGLENIYDAPWRKTIFPTSMLFPTRRMAFETYEFRVPRDYEGACDECYPGWPYLPADILGHNHFSHAMLNDADVRESLIEFSSRRD